MLVIDDTLLSTNYPKHIIKATLDYERNQKPSNVPSLCIMDNLIDCLDDIWKLNIIYTVVLLASANNIKLNEPIDIIMNFNASSNSPDTALDYVLSSEDDIKPSLITRMARRLGIILDSLIVYIQGQFYEHTATSIASFSVLIIVLSIICCFVISLMREEERKIKEQYKKLNAGSSQSFIAINDQGTYHKIVGGGASQYGGTTTYLVSRGTKGGGGKLGNFSAPTTQAPAPFVSRSDSHKLHVIELRRETYFGLVRLLKPGCRTIVLLCDAQSRLKLLTKFYQCIYPYRKNKTIQFAFLLIEKNIGWYEDLLKLALSEKRDLHINPINCVGTVLVLSGFKKYFSVYHASDSRCEPDESFILLEESLLDNFPNWLERLFAGKASRYYVKYWPNQMR